MADHQKWKRKVWPTHIYDYNYKVSEGYYKPQAEFMETRSSQERKPEAPPQHQSYAERFANRPWYGSTRGLPYGEDKSALNEPLLKPSERQYRASSLLREMRNQEEEDIPLHIRANRRRKKFEEEDDELGIRPRLTRHISMEVDSKNLYKEINDKLKTLDDRLNKLGPPAPRSSTTEVPTRSFSNYPRTSVVSRQEERYNLPSSGTTVHKSSRSEVSHYDSSSSRPPFSPRVRKISFTEEASRPLPRPRLHSIGDFTELPRSSRRSSVTEDEATIYTNRAGKLREERRGREAKEFSDNVNKMVDKMRAKNVDFEDAYKVKTYRGSRASSLDPQFKKGK